MTTGEDLKSTRSSSLCSLAVESSVDVVQKRQREMDKPFLAGVKWHFWAMKYRSNSHFMVTNQSGSYALIACWLWVLSDYILCSFSDISCAISELVLFRIGSDISWFRHLMSRVFSHVTTFRVTPAQLVIWICIESSLAEYFYLAVFEKGAK